MSSGMLLMGEAVGVLGSRAAVHRNLDRLEIKG